MSNIAIHLEHIGKQYHIGRRQQRHKSLRDALAYTLAAPFRRAGKLLRGQATGAAELDEAIWALNDVSFDVQRGEVVGIIGRNGAGKSTLLKILSRITGPTRGFAELHGRIGSLIEVGTGFHAELTGRENIYLNGAILGMKKAEINSKLDQIVDFAEVEQFIDTPVKHYSTGMYLRLAFAVAAHLEPDILVVDEVLSVGDASFQKKCLDKMQEVGQQGRTILFVSHNLPAITRLCSRAILLDRGKVVKDGPSHRVVSNYLLSDLGSTAAREWSTPAKAPGNDIVRLRAVRVKADDGRVTDALDIRNPIHIEMEYDVLKAGHVLVPDFSLYNNEGLRIFLTFDSDPAWRRRPRPIGRYTSTVKIPGNFLSEGMVIVESCMSTLDPFANHFEERHVASFQVIDTMDGDSARGDYTRNLPGVVRPLLPWATHFSPDRHTDTATSDIPRSHVAHTEAIAGELGGIGVVRSEDSYTEPVKHKGPLT